MPKFHVMVPEVHYQVVEIEAEDMRAAARAAMDGNGDELEGVLEFGYGLDVDSLDVKNLETGIQERICVLFGDD